MEESKPKNLKEILLARIKSQELTMRPKTYFALRVAALIAVAALVLLVSVFIFNFLFFTMRISGHFRLASSGIVGFFVFLQLFPWVLFVIDILLIVLLERLLRHFRFAYKQPTLYLFIGLLALVVAVGLFVDRSSRVNDRLLEHADAHHLPGPFNRFYEGARRMPPPEMRARFINGQQR